MPVVSKVLPELAVPVVVGLVLEQLEWQCELVCGLVDVVVVAVLVFVVFPPLTSATPEALAPPVDQLPVLPPT